MVGARSLTYLLTIENILNTFPVKANSIWWIEVKDLEERHHIRNGNENENENVKRMRKCINTHWKWFLYNIHIFVFQLECAYFYFILHFLSCHGGLIPYPCGAVNFLLETFIQWMKHLKKFALKMTTTSTYYTRFIHGAQYSTVTKFKIGDNLSWAQQLAVQKYFLIMSTQSNYPTGENQRYFLLLHQWLWI